MVKTKKIVIVILSLVLIILLVFYGIIIYLRIRVSNLVRSATDSNVTYNLSYISKNDYEKISQLLIQIGELDDNGNWDLGDNTVLSASLNPSYFDLVYYDCKTNRFIVNTSYSSELEFVDANQTKIMKGGSYYFRIYFDFDISDMQWNIVEVELINSSC